uniref:Uncharacterized protein n=1 Tax=Setaria viridis TaxID=4556 RepID=A0A4U6U8R5_SETVI|nr:hypothetical protein SEVIR_7G252900v2 [Setaria viridis]
MARLPHLEFMVRSSTRLGSPIDPNNSFPDHVGSYSVAVSTHLSVRSTVSSVLPSVRRSLDTMRMYTCSLCEPLIHMQLCMHWPTFKPMTRVSTCPRQRMTDGPLHNCICSSLYLASCKLQPPSRRPSGTAPCSPRRSTSPEESPLQHATRLPCPRRPPSEGNNIIAQHAHHGPNDTIMC